MPSNRTGDPTATQAPSAKPGPEVFPEQAIPIDTDPPNAATFAQAYKVVADFLAWHATPRGVIPASPAGLDPAFVASLYRYRNALLQTRDLVDPRGFIDMGRITRWHEDWGDTGFPAAGPGAFADVAWFGRWLKTIVPGSGTPNLQTFPGYIFPPGPGTPAYVGGTLVLDTGAVPGAACNLGIQASESSGGLVTEDSDMVFQTETVQLGGETVWGLMASNLSGATGSFPSTNPIAAAIISGRPTATHVELYTYNGSGSPVLTSLGTAGDSSVRWRLELVGANASDDATARVKVYGDGDTTKPLANIAIDFAPVNPENRVFWRPFFRIRSQAGRQIGRWGRTDLAFARWPGDIGVP